MSSRNKKLIVLFILLALVSFLIGIGISYLQTALAKIEKVEVNEENLSINESLNEKYGEVQNIALFGVDNTSDVGRSDSMMILTLDKKNKKAKITSLMRDCYVDIDGHGKDKLNHAYAFGGPELAIKTINENFGLNISDFITVNFESLPKVIDVVGGVEIDVDAEELKYINDYINDLNQKNKTNYSTINTVGVQHLNGTQAMAYCRIRYTAGGDYKRTERHREVLEKLIEKGLSTSVTKYPTIINELLPMVKTSLSSTELISIAMDGAKFGKTLEQNRFPLDEHCEEAMINNISYIRFDEVETKRALEQWIFED